VWRWNGILWEIVQPVQFAKVGNRVETITPNREGHIRLLDGPVPIILAFLLSAVCAFGQATVSKVMVDVKMSDGKFQERELTPVNNYVIGFDGTGQLVVKADGGGGGGGINDGDTLTSGLTVNRSDTTPSFTVQKSGLGVDERILWLSGADDDNDAVIQITNGIGSETFSVTSRGSVGGRNFNATSNITSPEFGTTITGLAATPSVALNMFTNTAATSTVQQWSPTIRWGAQGWKTDATAASRAVDFRAFVATFSGAANPLGEWTLQSRTGTILTDADYVTRFRVDTSGNATASGTITGSNLSGTNTGDMPPAGTGSELQFRSSGSALGAVTRSSVSGAALTLGDAEAMGVTSTPLMTLRNTTAAAAGAQQVSPSLVMEGRGWRTNATAQSQVVRFRQNVLPVQGAANPSVTWRLQSEINNDGVWSDMLNVTTSGAIRLNGHTVDTMRRRPDVDMIIFHGEGGFSTGIGSGGFKPGIALANAALVTWSNDSPASTSDITFNRVAASVLGLSAANGAAGATLELREQTAPAAPAADRARIYLEDNGSGKTRLMVRFATGAPQQIAIEP
jgi:hypothetical protein